MKPDGSLRGECAQLECLQKSAVKRKRAGHAYLDIEREKERATFQDKHNTTEERNSLMGRNEAYRQRYIYRFYTVCHLPHTYKPRAGKDPVYSGEQHRSSDTSRRTRVYQALVRERWISNPYYTR